MIVLKKVELSHFKNILDSGPVAIEPDVTCLVGKNESGKTAFLQALHRLNPAQQSLTFNAQRQYPAWLEKQHRRQKNLNHVTPVKAEFELDDKTWSELKQQFGRTTLASRNISISRQYDNKLIFDFDLNEASAVAHMARDIDFSGSGAVPTTLADYERLIETLGKSTHSDEGATKADRANAEKLTDVKGTFLGKASDVKGAIVSFLETRIPLFFYFDEYSQLPGSVKIRQILETDKNKLSPAELTARSLLDLAGAESEYLLNPDYETRKRELENIANAITHDVLTFCTNPELRTEIDITLKTENVANGQQKVLDELKIRLYDNRHLLSLPFEERSTGFRWFFSFLAAFSAYEHSERPIVILLDEPGTGLHARAQADFLGFIDERLSRKCQVVYTTHSPFMVQPKKLLRVRLVQDDGRDIGSRVTDDVLSIDSDTLFPLQGALGYDMVQHLFIAPHNLVVEGTSDFTYLSLISDYLREKNRISLDPKWSIVPVGGADLVPTFVALLGKHLAVTALVDSRKEGHQRLQQLKQHGILKDTSLVTIGSVLNSKLADIEDLFLNKNISCWSMRHSAQLLFPPNF
ncbi:AAA family ATPase [Bradyrhizobium sp.]|uniref:AAA family ATPase n=1 Tax=Bradyrhizobium sp. TaxID=376 RepID=UPI003C7431D9